MCQSINVSNWDFGKSLKMQHISRFNWVSFSRGANRKTPLISTQNLAIEIWPEESSSHQLDLLIEGEKGEAWAIDFQLATNKCGLHEVKKKGEEKQENVFLVCGFAY